MFLDDTACNLASLNLMKFFDADGRFDVDDYLHAIRLWTIVLEICVLMAQFPSKVIAERSDVPHAGPGLRQPRRLLMAWGSPTTATAAAPSAAPAAILTGEAYATTAEMADELGPFPRYEANREPMLRVIRNHRRAAYNAPHGEYEGLRSRRSASTLASPRRTCSRPRATPGTGRWSSARSTATATPRPRSSRRPAR